MIGRRTQESSGSSGSSDDARTQPLSGSAPMASGPPGRVAGTRAEPDPAATRTQPFVDPADGVSDRRATVRPGPRGGPERVSRTSSTATAAGRQRRARLRLARVDPWSVLLLSLLVSLFLAVVVVVAVVVLYAVLEAAGVPDSINALVAEVTRTPGEAEPAPLLSAGRALRAAGVIAVVDVILLTALATLSAVLYNLCASFTGGLEVTLAEDG